MLDSTHIKAFTGEKEEELEGEEDEIIEKMIERLKKAKSGSNLLDRVLNVHDRMAKQLKEIKDEPIKKVKKSSK